jgi:hypothetical protein
MSVFKSFFFCLAVLGSTAVFGQAANSPFSTFGIGEPYGSALVHNQGMAGVGVSQPQFWFVNNQNPALLVYNYYTVFQAGVVGERRTIKSDSISQKGFNGNLNYLVMALPFKRGKWAMSAGLMPFSAVNYKIKYTEEIENSDSLLSVTEQGSGGLSQLYWAHGIRLTPDWSIGVKASYIFSSINNDYYNYLINSAQVVQYIVAVKDQTYVRDFLFTAGLSFSKDSVFTDEYRVSAGLVYNFGSNLKAERNTIFERRDASGSPLTRDTLTTKNGQIYMPPSLTFGASISKGGRWSLGAEVNLQDWSKFRSVSNEDEGLDKAWKMAIGGEFTPDPTALDKFFKRITYRAGISMEKYPFLVENPENPGKLNQVRDFGINFGLSMPAGRSSIDLGFRTGKRGNISETVLEETYWKIYFGITFNDQWFIRRKFD